jgi:hypothetical protein
VTRTTRTALAALLAALATAARADAPCAADAKRFCDSKSTLELVSCLQAHRPELAPACVQRLERALVYLQNVKFDCEPDAFQFCRTAGPGLPMVDCLSAKQGQLTPRCQQFFDVARSRDEAVQKACSDQASRGCPGVPTGRGELWICVGLSGEDLAPECQAAIGGSSYVPPERQRR